MKTLFENINQILIEWNPIGVDEAITIDEYCGYVPEILEAVKDEKLLTNRLINILTNKMELDYDPSNELHVKEVQQVCKKIMQSYDKYKKCLLADKTRKITRWRGSANPLFL